MPSAEFFRGLGLFVINDFFDAVECARIRREMLGTPFKPGTIAPSSGENQVDENKRRVMCAKVRGSTAALVTERLESIRSRLSQHFGVSLAAAGGADFLIYNQ